MDEGFYVCRCPWQDNNIQQMANSPGSGASISCVTHKLLLILSFTAPWSWTEFPEIPTFNTIIMLLIAGMENEERGWLSRLGLQRVVGLFMAPN